MDETNTTWKNHSFTLLIFGGIVALCFIFFVLGMLVGRNQGQRLAEIAAAEEAASKPVADTAEDFPLEFSELLFYELINANQYVELYKYDGDNHNISNYFSTAMQRTIEFFDRYVK